MRDEVMDRSGRGGGGQGEGGGEACESVPERDHHRAQKLSCVLGDTQPPHTAAD